MNTKRTQFLTAIAVLWLSTINYQLSASPLGTAFTYQGRLNDGANAASGSYDLKFTLYEALSGPAQVGPALTNAATLVTNGSFTVTLDFGSVFDGNARWLEIGVRSHGAAADFTALAPRQSLTPAPYASYSPSAGSAGSAAVAATANGVAAGSITSAALAPGAVTAPALAPGAVSQLGTPTGTQTNAVQVNTNGWVGIGTNTPHAGVEIAGGSSILSPVVYAEVQDGTGSFTNLWGATGVAFSTNLLAVAATADKALTFIDTIGNSLTYLSGIANGQGAFTNLSYVQDVAFWTNRILAAASPSDNAVTIIDLSTPSAPLWKSVLRDGVGEFNLLAGAYAVAFNDRMLAIAANTDNAVTLVTVTNPAGPRLLGYMQNGFNTVTNLGGPRALAFSGNLLAIAAYDSNAVVLADVTDPSSPVQRSTIKQGLNGFSLMNGPQALAFSGSLLAIAAGSAHAVNLVDVANPGSPVLKSTIALGASGNPVGLCFFSQNGRTLLAVSSSTDNTLGVYDVTDPMNPAGRALLKDGLAGLHYLRAPQKLAVNANGRLAVAASTSAAVTLLGLADQRIGLASDTWVGIGTTLPKAALDVIGDVLIENASRFQASASHVELGVSTTATGNYSTAMGYGTCASGYYSTAMGQSTTASGSSSTAIGNGTTASGSSSTAMGNGTTASGDYSTAMGYYSATTNSYTMAAGRQAKAIHQGAFVWADSQNSDFASTANDQFLIRAAGGVGINKNNPTTALDVNGTITATNFSGNGSGITNLSAAQLVSGTVADARLALNVARTNQVWLLNGNRSTTSTNYLGTADYTALELRVNGARALRLEPDPTSPNVIGGYSGNVVSSGFYGATIGGGGSSNAPNFVGANYATVVGGMGNTASSGYATAMGSHTTASGYGSTAMGLSTTANGNYSTAMGYYSATTNACTMAAGMQAKAIHQGAFVWADSQGTDFASTGNNQFLIRAQGGVGINKNNPTTALDVNGSIRLNNNDLFLRDNSDLNHGLGWYGNIKPYGNLNLDGPALYGYSGGVLGIMDSGFMTNVVLYWNRAGNVGIGTNSPSVRLEVVGTAAVTTSTDGFVDIGPANSWHITMGTQDIQVKNTPTAWDTLYLNWYGGNVSVASTNLYVSAGSGVSVNTRYNQGYRFYVNGTTFSTGGWGGSDVRWKKNIQPVTGALDKVVRMQGVNFEWRRDEFPGHEFGEGIQLGFVAQEVEKVLPEAVHTDTEGYKAIAYEKLTAVLNEAIKEQQGEIKGQQSELATLQARHAALERDVTELKALVKTLIAKVNGGGQ